MNVKNKLCLLLFFLVLIQSCLFVFAESAHSIYREGQALAKKLEPNLQGAVNSDKGAKDIQVMFGGNEDVKHQSEELGNLPSLGEKARENKSNVGCTKAECNVSSIMGSEATREREAKLEEYGFRKDKDEFPEDTKGYMDKVNYEAKKYENSFDAIKGTYKDCTPKEQTHSYKETSECDEYYDVKHNNCPISQVVEIDPHYTYECNKKREEAIKTCYDEITSIACRKSSECDNSGIIVKSIQGDMKWEYNFPTLTIGTVGDNYWRGDCAVFDRTTSFQVRNISKITEFRIFEVGIDDYLWIKINGNSVYVGPVGGDRLEIFNGGGLFGRGVTTNGNNRHFCERNSSSTIAVNIDLKPYLKEGENNIWTRTVVGGAGESWMKISAKQHCCKDEDWVIQRETTCKYEGM